MSDLGTGVVLGLTLGAVVAVAEFLGMSEYADRRVNAAWSEADRVADQPIIVGKGQTLKAKGVELMVGQLAINRHDHTGSMPVFVSENQGGYALQCVLTDEHGALLGGGGIPIPPRLSAPSLAITVNRDVSTKAKLDCSLVKP
jgi:hypothetical protein